MVTPAAETASLPPKVEALFARFCSIEDANERELFRLAHPVLASARALAALGSALGAPGKGHNAAKAASAARGYAELARFAEAVRQDPRRYPVGAGPLEPILQQVLRGSLRLDKAVKLAADESVASLLSAEYVSALGRFAARSATQGNWKPALLLCRLLLPAARAAEGPDARDIRLAAEREWLVAAGSILIQIADGDTYRGAREAGDWLLQAAGEGGDRGLLAWTHFYLGVLHLDPLTAFGTAENYRLEYEMWIRRGAEELGGRAVEGLPTPRVTLEMAAEHMRQAASAAAAALDLPPEEAAPGILPPAEIGVLHGMALKALVQALSWLELAGGMVDPEEIARAALQALDALDPVADPARWLLVATQLERRKIAYSRAPLDRLLSVSADEWIRRSGPHLAAATLKSILVFQRDRDPWEALERSTHAASLFASRPMENERTGFLQLQLSLITRAALPQEPPPDQLRSALEEILARRDDAERIAAALIALAGETLKAGEERLGLEMLAMARRSAPGFARRHARQLAYQEALLWTGLASDRANLRPPDFDQAIDAYGRALDLFLREGFPNLARELLSRLHRLSLLHDAASAPGMTAVLIATALRAEIAAGEPAAALVRDIGRELTVALAESGGGALLPVVWQLAKGLRWSATLSGGYRAAPAADGRIRDILADMEALRRAAPPGSLIDPRPVSGTPLFEAWLTSYIRGERYQGDEPWQRMANLKITLDARVQDLLVPEGGATAADGEDEGKGDGEPSRPAGRLDWMPWHLADIQAALDEETVLLLVYIGVEAGGRPTSYALLVTRDEIRAHGRAPALDSTEYQFKDSGRTGEFSAFAVQVQQLRHEVQAEPGSAAAGPLAVTPAGQAALSQALDFYFGGLGTDLSGFRAAGKTHLLVAPHDALHFAPFHLFGKGAKRGPGGMDLPGEGEGGPLADDWTVTYLPNLALLAAPRGRMGRARSRRWNRAASIGLGFAGSPGGWTEIPEAAQEAVEVARILGVDPILDAQATKAEVLAALSRSNAVHLSTHGAMDVDAPSLQFLVVHPPEDDQAGRVFAHEILDLDLAGVDLVSLSACESALGRIDRSDNLRGFPAALFSAGVGTVIGTLWEVNADASVLFFRTFYREYADGARRLEAFRTAQEETRERYPEHRDWGAFYLAGAWD